MYGKHILDSEIDPKTQIDKISQLLHDNVLVKQGVIEQYLPKSFKDRYPELFFSDAQNYLPVFKMHTLDYKSLLTEDELQDDTLLQNIEILNQVDAQQKQLVFLCKQLLPESQLSDLGFAELEDNTSGRYFDISTFDKKATEYATSLDDAKQEPDSIQGFPKEALAKSERECSIILGAEFLAKDNIFKFGNNKLNTIQKELNALDVSKCDPTIKARKALAQKSLKEKIRRQEFAKTKEPYIAQYQNLQKEIGAYLKHSSQDSPNYQVMHDFNKEVAELLRAVDMSHYMPEMQEYVLAATNKFVELSERIENPHKVLGSLSDIDSKRAESSIAYRFIDAISIASQIAIFEPKEKLANVSVADVQKIIDGAVINASIYIQTPRKRQSKVSCMNGYKNELLDLKKSLQSIQKRNSLACLPLIVNKLQEINHRYEGELNALHRSKLMHFRASTTSEIFQEVKNATNKIKPKSQSAKLKL